MNRILKNRNFKLICIVFISLPAILGGSISFLRIERCPESLQEWNSKRDFITERLTSALVRGAEPDIAIGTLKSTNEYLDRCINDFKSDSKPQLLACLGTIKSVVQKIESTFVSTDYYELDDVKMAVKLPSEFTNQEFLHHLAKAKFDSLTQIQDDIKKMNISRHSKGLAPILMTPTTGTQGNLVGDFSGQNRIAFYVPGENYNQFIQAVIFNNMTFKSNETPHQYSVISVSHGSASTPRKVYFSDYWRTKDKNNEISVNHHIFGRINCRQCHLYGPRPVPPPDITHVAEEFKENLRQFNQAVLLNQEPSGDEPVLGSENFQNRTDAWISQCSGSSDLSQIKRIREAMSCTKCHTGEKLVALNAGTYIRSFREVEEGRMPPSIKSWSDSEKLALTNCLKREAIDLYKEWLKRTPCPLNEEISLQQSSSTQNQQNEIEF